MTPLKSTSRTLRASEERALLERWRREHDEAARAELIERMLPLVRHIAKVYVGRGEPFDDLVQVGCVGLVKAIDRFDLDRGLRLSTFAAPTISGEIKRHFRDHGWTVRPPRDLQELYVRVRRESTRSAARLGRNPTVAELASALDSSEESVLDAMEAGRGYSAVSVETSVEPDGRAVLDSFGSDDPELELADVRATLSQGLDVLAPRERRIVLLRYVNGLTQREIADQVGISQMHVSRLLQRSLVALRGALVAR